MPQLIVKGPTYYSEGDEAAFFGWLQGIPSVQGISGRLRDLHIDLAAQSLPDSDLRELIGILYRYGMDMRGLADFETPSNTRWFRSRTAYWHGAVFGGPIPC